MHINVKLFGGLGLAFTLGVRPEATRKPRTFIVFLDRGVTLLLNFAALCV